MDRRPSPSSILALCADPVDVELATLVFIEPAALAAEGASGDAPPAWVQLFPAAPEVVARDGRRWTLPDPQAVIDAFAANRADLPFDFDHTSALKAPKGEPSPASGWIKEVAMRAGALCARVDWTPAGAAALASRAYRYVSPAFRHDAEGRITSLHSAGLVNRPALDLPALAHAGAASPPSANPDPKSASDFSGARVQPGAPMALSAALAAALGLPATASDEQAVQAIGDLRKPPSLASFVPRQDYDLAVTQRDEAKSALSTAQRADHDKAVTAFLDGAVAGGKMAPASRPHYLALCASDAGFDEVKKLIGTTPTFFKEVATGDPSRPAGGEGLAITAEEHGVAVAMGLTDEQFLKAKA